MKHQNSEAEKQKKSTKPADTTEETKPENTDKQQETEEKKVDEKVQEAADEKVAEPNELESTKKALEALQAKYDQLNDTYLRSLAEFDNYRKRSLKEKSELIKTGGESVLLNILTVVDDMERGIDAMNNTEDVNAVREGMELIHDKFTNFLKQNGISEIETKGKDFDCDLHEAIATIPATDETMKGKITDCAQKGYYLHDKVIRFAKVVVGK